MRRTRSGAVIRCRRIRMAIIAFAAGFAFAITAIFVVVMPIVVIHNRGIVVMMMMRRLSIGVASKAEKGACGKEKSVELEVFHNNLHISWRPEPPYV